jgi:hypothetical protein
MMILWRSLGSTLGEKEFEDDEEDWEIQIQRFSW